MIRPEELRKGNLLQWEDDSQNIVKVISIVQQAGLYFIYYDEINKNEHPGAALLDEFIPIHLTKELLLNCGFVEIKRTLFIDQKVYEIYTERKRIIYSAGFIFKELNDEQFIIIAENINTVHLLQNLIFFYIEKN